MARDTVKYEFCQTGILSIIYLFTGGCRGWGAFRGWKGQGKHIRGGGGKTLREEG